MAATIALTDSGLDATVSLTHTYASKSLGAAASDRLIAVGISRVPNGAVGVISTVTVGGVSATQIVSTNAGSLEHADIWIAAVPTGTTGNIVITASTDHFTTRISVWRLIGALATATDFGTDTDSNPATYALDIGAGGVACAQLTHRSDSETTYSWSNLTEDTDAASTVNSQYTSSASAAFASVQTNLSISATASQAGVRFPRMAVASFPEAPAGQPAVKRMGGVPFASPNRGVW